MRLEFQLFSVFLEILFFFPFICIFALVKLISPDMSFLSRKKLV